MKTDALVDQAKFIFTTGRLIHEQILKLQNRHLAAKASTSSREFSMAQLHAIGVVRKQGPLAMGALAEQLGISAPSASVMVDRLVEKGFLLRAHSAEDRRKVVVRISPEAIQEIEEMENCLLGIFTALVQRLGPDTSQKWCDVLTVIKAILLDNGPGCEPTREVVVDPLAFG